MGFFHYRVKKYIEVRVADSVPIEKALGYVALLKGIVYDEENLRRLDKELAFINELSEVQAAVEAIERDGYNASIYKGWTAAGWAGYLIKLAGDALSDRDKEYLENVRAFWNYSEQAG